VFETTTDSKYVLHGYIPSRVERPQIHI